MSLWTRREWLRNGALLSVGAALLPRVARAERAPFLPGRPRALVQIQLGGGVDSVLTTDPKRRAEVEPFIDVPYDEPEIARAGTREVGPLLRELAPLVARMAILNGVQAQTVAHRTGNVQVQHMRTVCPTNGLGLVGTLGALRTGDAPLHDVRFPGGGVDVPPADVISTGRSLRLVPTTNPDATLLARLVELARHASARAQMLAALDEQRRRATPAAAPPLDVVCRLLARLPPAPLPAAPRLLEPSALAADVREEMAAAERRFSGILRDTLFVLRHRLAPAVFISMPGSWDTHFDNLAGQKRQMQLLAAGLRYFVGELDRRDAEGRALADEVGLLVSSELGRFPVLNEFAGKDHFPELPVLLLGPGVRPGTYGRTDRRLIATPISVADGSSGGARTIVPVLDDVGATVLHWFGIDDPACVGYLGRRLDFMLA